MPWTLIEQWLKWPTRKALKKRIIDLENHVRYLQDELCEARTFLGVAHGCGVHDDSDVIQRYVNAATEIRFPPGVFVITRPMDMHWPQSSHEHPPHL